ncbi:SDR family NAD(P)-dependent oxidoreductase [Nocardia yunnanensis]|uniref:SDR family NAD(P)-dependent oxidoreductase n=1 Tax=Nocardia yunnanensis TaxID=2382165 RepID=A0A386Z861_9NOCA|nr:NmrA family NAD(P)-binding protein [Nocardia yunnanensis]AYF73810.1 SDR family NAD(P)-dependent oxidoreductase [Nocardia yunnanensis]
MIVIMGATGATGNALLRRLAGSGVPCRALSREPDQLREKAFALAGVDVRHADATDADSLRAAFSGATQLFLTMVNRPDQVELETRAIDIAAECGIGHVVKLSAPTAAPDSPVAIARWHFAIEEVLRNSGMAHTILRPYAFMQKLLSLAPSIAAHRVISGTLGAAACNFIDCRDIADVAAAALTRREIAGGTYTLTGSRTYSYAQLAGQLTGLLGVPIRYVDLSPSDFRAELVERSGLPDWLADHIVEIQQLAVAQPERPTDTVARVLGRPPRTLESFLSEHLDAFTQPAAVRR